jgi:hypothetical protein
MHRVGFEPTIPVFEWPKTVHIVDRAANLICYYAVIGTDKFPSSCAVANGMYVRTIGQLDCLRTILYNVATYNEFPSRSERTYYA